MQGEVSLFLCVVTSCLAYEIFLSKKLLTFIITFNVEKLEVFDKFDNLKLLINFSNLKIETCI